MLTNPITSDHYKSPFMYYLI